MTVVATFVGGWGHAEPLLPMARLAGDHGHEVVFAGQSAIVPRLDALGYRTVVVGPDTLVQARQAMVPVDREHERAVLRDHFVARYGRQRASALAELFERERPDLVVCDEGDVGAVAAAERLGLPCVSVVVLAAGRMMTPDLLADAWDGLRADIGLPGDASLDRIGGALRLTPAPRSFRAPEQPWPTRLRAVRHPIVERPRSHAAPSRRVYVTLGTIFNLESGDLPERLLAAAGRIDAEVLVTTGPGIEPGELSDVAPHVDVQQYVPQADVLPDCDAVVCHAGSGTLVATLSLGIPVVALPMGADQLDNADRCAELGVGVVLDPLAAAPEEIACAVDTVRRDQRYRRAARALAAEAASQPRIDDVAELTDLLVAGRV